jgi:hypothetical protein
MEEVLQLRCELQELTLIRELMFGVLTMMLIEAVLLMILIYKLGK